MASSKRAAQADPREYPYRASRATRMLSSTLEVCGKTQRQVALDLGYRSAVVVSHMASGRVPIPYEKVGPLCDLLAIPEREFALAVLEQREPKLLELLYADEGLNSGSRTRETGIVADLRSIGGDSLDFTLEQERILREVAVDAKPARRWLSVHELAAVEMLRGAFPKLRDRGLDPLEREIFDSALNAARKK